MSDRDVKHGEGAARFLAQLETLHALAERLNDLQDVMAIGEAITSELLTLIDYHSCRIYRLQPNGRTLYPVAFSGELAEYIGDEVEDLIVQMGEGLTGHVAETKKTYYTPNALYDSFAEDIPDTDDIDETMLGVPFVYGDELVGLAVLSKLGVDQFDEDDIRMMEVFAPHVAVAMVNAELLQRERESARGSEALLALSQALTGLRDIESVLKATMTAVPTLVPCLTTLAYRRDEKGDFHLLTAGSLDAWPEGGPPAMVPGALAGPLTASIDAPFVVPADAIAHFPPELHTLDIPNETLVTPLRWDPEGTAMLVVIAEDPDHHFSEREIAMAGGIGHIASLALMNAGSFERLEESHDRLRALDAMKTTFLEAVSHDLRTPLSAVLGIALTFESGAVDLESDDARDLLVRLASNARRLEKLLADLLDLDRLMRGIIEPNRRPTEIGALVTTVVRAADFLGSHEVLLDLEPVTVAVDGAKVERIIENLLVNATRHTPPGTPIWVNVRRDQGGVLLTVEDSGPGVPEESRESIFEAFRQGPQSNRHSPGVGIGLSLVARFAELHGGRAWVDDREGGGASFRVWLPDAPIVS